MKKEEIRTILDDEGVIYTIDKIIGEGGQGMVARLKDSNLAVKLMVANGEIVSDEKIHKLYKSRVEDTIILGLERELNLCVPQAVVASPMCGYIMHMLSELQPIDKLIYNQNCDGDDYKEYLKKTDGMKKRIEVLLELSRTLAKLHSKGLVYCDISPNNVFYSDTKNFSKVWLIDCDNLRYENEVRSGIYTPGYCAPEVASGLSTNTIFSDSFSFAVLAFKILTMCSPFLPTAALEESTEGWDVSTISATQNNQVDKISANNIPWLKETLEPTEFDRLFKPLLTPKLIELFDNTFSEKGRTIQTSRPSMRQWYSAFKEAMFKIHYCDCGQYILMNDTECPCCKNKIDYRFYARFGTYLPFDASCVNAMKESLKESGVDDFYNIDLAIEKAKKNRVIFDNAITINEKMQILNTFVDEITITDFPTTCFDISLIANKTKLMVVNKMESKRIVRAIVNGAECCLEPGGYIEVGPGSFAALLFKDKNSGLYRFIKIASK